MKKQLIIYLIMAFCFNASAQDVSLKIVELDKNERIHFAESNSAIGDVFAFIVKKDFQVAFSNDDVYWQNGNVYFNKSSLVKEKGYCSLDTDNLKTTNFSATGTQSKFFKKQHDSLIVKKGFIKTIHEAGKSFIAGANGNLGRVYSYLDFSYGYKNVLDNFGCYGKEGVFKDITISDLKYHTGDTFGIVTIPALKAIY